MAPSLFRGYTRRPTRGPEIDIAEGSARVSLLSCPTAADRSAIGDPGLEDSGLAMIGDPGSVLSKIPIRGIEDDAMY